MLIQRAEVEGRAPVDVRVRGEHIVELGSRLATDRGEVTVDAAGGALLPGLHDHHIHLFALAAARNSVRCGPPEVRNADDLARALARAPGSGWIRAVGYCESVAGELDRDRLDAWVAERPVRIQHRSGALWVLNSAAAAAVGLDAATEAGVERARDARATGRVYDGDAWLRARLPGSAVPALHDTSRVLARFGVTGVTDATASNGAAETAALGRAVAEGALLQRVIAMGGPSLDETDLGEDDAAGVACGAHKVVIAERALPDFDTLCAAIRAAHARARTVAIHCVTRAELVFAIGAFAEAGTAPGDRIEHASIAPPDCVALLARTPLTVVTQPGFLHARGDVYAADVAADELPYLYRGRSFLDAGIPLGGGTDAPFGPSDPWVAMRAAVDRRSAGGVSLGAREALSPERALALFTTEPAAPGGPARRVAAGARADLCLLDCPWDRARRELSSEHVVAAVGAGRLLHGS